MDASARSYWHRQFLADWYRGVYPMSDARGLVFQYNPVTQDRRITGTAASLVGIEAAVEAVESIGNDTYYEIGRASCRERV